MSSYPNPCDSCQQCPAYCGSGCEAWKMRFRTIWKQFNAYPKRQEKKKALMRTKFRYEHPDRIRYYLRKNPCEGCQFEKLCEVPCTEYFNWYDARMAVLREKLNADDGGRRNSEHVAELPRC